MNKCLCAPPSYETLHDTISHLRESHPTVRVFSIGKSVLSKNIYALSLGKLETPSLFVGGIGASQWMTTLLLCRFCEDVCTALEQEDYLAGIDVARVLGNQSVVIIPCLNPDGLDRIAGGDTQGDGQRPGAPVWQANARGVDLRRNFGVGFARWQKENGGKHQNGPGPAGYGGHRPFSEPESRAAAGACISLRARQLYVLETHGEEIQYRYENRAPARAQLMAQVLALSSGYRVTTAKETALWGGLMAWYIEKMNRPGFTVRVGRGGKSPLPLAELEPIYARLVEMLLLGTFL